jgi:hypothetical protein
MEQITLLSDPTIKITYYFVVLMSMDPPSLYDLPCQMGVEQSVSPEKPVILTCYATPFANSWALKHLV